MGKKQKQISLLSKEEIYLLFKECGMGDKVISPNFTKKFGKRKEIPIEEVYLEYATSKSKYASSIIAELTARYPWVVSSAKTLRGEREQLEKMLSNVSTTLDKDVPNVQALEKHLVCLGKSPKQAKYLAGRACDETGVIKRTSKWYTLFI